MLLLTITEPTLLSLRRLLLSHVLTFLHPMRGLLVVDSSFSCQSQAAAILMSDAWKEGPVIPLLQTLRINLSVAERAAQCCDGVLQGVGLVVHERRQLPHHPPLSHHLHWVKLVSQDQAGPDQSVLSLPVSSGNAAAPANYSES
ncbi:unnamed protein product [Pleuronectes platessa]|uniref:Uncharacterized protein n=1 Tax=Pleuronectes platessa TaxID=8262 RepID=A0A9N7V7Q7_PLEPL|nr:unnamed protein product [Pleuronectes platessa]